MTTAFWGAEAVDTCLAAPRRAGRALKRYNAAVRRALDPVSWFIYRIREPAMRNLFMAPRNTFRMEEAVLELLAGDFGRGWSFRSRLLAFKMIYYITKLAQLSRRLPGLPNVPQAPSTATAG
jgi:hypothetical protein